LLAAIVHVNPDIVTGLMKSAALLLSIINLAIKHTAQGRPPGRDIAPKDGPPTPGILLPV
jgi:hypothetical protein